MSLADGKIVRPIPRAPSSKDGHPISPVLPMIESNRSEKCVHNGHPLRIHFRRGDTSRFDCAQNTG